MQGSTQKEPWWWSWTARTWRRSDTDSYLCYVLFFVVFFTDYSLIAVVYHASLFLYAILAQQPSTQFWQVGLHLWLHTTSLPHDVFAKSRRDECHSALLMDSFACTTNAMTCMTDCRTLCNGLAFGGKAETSSEALRTAFHRFQAAACSWFWQTYLLSRRHFGIELK